MAAAGGATTPPAVLLLIKGLPGSGKTALARELARRLRWPLIDKDDARDCLQPLAAASAATTVAPATAAAAEAENAVAAEAEEAAAASSAAASAAAAVSTSSTAPSRSSSTAPVAPVKALHLPLPAPPPPSPAAAAAAAAAAQTPASAPAATSPAPAPDWNALSYDIMFKYAETQLSLGLSTIIDCPFSRVELYRRAEQLACRHGALIAVVDCVPSDEALWRVRLERRAEVDAGTERAHKPQSWHGLQRLLEGYDGCWRWSVDGSVQLPHRFEADTTAHGTQALAGEVVQWVVMSVLVRQPLHLAVGGPILTQA